MALTLVGLDDCAPRVYSWIGDLACDRAASAREEWLRTGEGLVALEGLELTQFVCKALRPTTVSVVYGAAEGSMANIAACNRLAVAYGVTEIKNGPSIRRVPGPGGLRLHDDILAWLETLKVVLVGAGAPDASGKRGDLDWRLLDHLGSLILADSDKGDLAPKV